MSSGEDPPPSREAELLAEIERLQEAVDTRTRIGIGVGLLMATEHLTQDRAREIVRNTSTRLGVRPCELADDIIAGHESQLATTEDPNQPA